MAQVAAAASTKKSPDDEESKTRVVRPRVYSVNASHGTSTGECMFDGDPKSYWNGGHQVGWNVPNWVILDFKHRVKVTKFAFKANGDNSHDPRQIQVQVTKKIDENQWTTVNSFTCPAGVSSWQEFPISLTGAPIRFWRIFIQSRHSRYQVYINAMRFEVADLDAEKKEASKERSGETQRDLFIRNLHRWLDVASIYDVTFVVGKPSEETKEFKGIKSLFGINSPYFDRLFKDKSDMKRCIETSVSIAGFSYVHGMILNDGKQSISRENILDVLQAANKYEMTVLQGPCAQWLDKFVRRQRRPNKLLKLIDRCLNLKLDESSLESLVTALIPKLSRRTLLKSSILMKLPLKSILTIVQSDKLVSKERHVWQFCKKWCVLQTDEEKKEEGGGGDDEVKSSEKTPKVPLSDDWKELMKNFIPHIRFEHSNGKWFVRVAVKSGLLSPDQVLQYSLEILNPKNRPKELRRRNRGLDAGLEEDGIGGNGPGIANGGIRGADQLERLKRGCVNMKYSLSMSSQYGAHCQNTFESLQDTTFTTGAATNRNHHEWIQASLLKPQKVVFVQISPGMMPGGWNNAYLRDSVLQYRKRNRHSGSRDQWVTVRDLQHVNNNVITEIPINVVTNAVRVWCPAQNWIGISVFKLFVKGGAVSSASDDMDEDPSYADESSGLSGEEMDEKDNGGGGDGDDEEESDSSIEESSE